MATGYDQRSRDPEGVSLEGCTHARPEEGSFHRKLATGSDFELYPYTTNIPFTNCSFCFCLRRIFGELLTFHSLIIRFVFVCVVFSVNF